MLGVSVDTVRRHADNGLLGKARTPGGQRLVDGGIADNLPMDVARAMGADRLIVVDVGSPLTPREELNDLLAVFSQMTSLLIASNVAAQLATLDESDGTLEEVAQRHLDQRRRVELIVGAVQRASRAPAELHQGLVLAPLS